MIKSVMRGVDAWLWRSGMHNPMIRAMVRAQLLFAGAALLGGGAAVAFSPWPLWFAVGVAIFANVFWGLARHLSPVAFAAYSSGLLLGVLLRFGIRLACVAGVLYVALALCNASAAALVCGVTAGMAVALGTFALVALAGHNQ